MSADALANRQTPFGTIVQKMVLPCRPPIEWVYLHPLALLYHLTEQSCGLRAAMHIMLSKLADGDLLRFILFIDECRPGNVLRPDKGRALQHILWSFVEWPEWLSVREQGWFTFGCIRSVAIETLPAGTSNLMKHVLHVFDEMKVTGGMIAGLLENDGPKLFKGRFAGFLGDEKGLKGVYNTKGPSGTKCCLSCKNVVQFMDTEVADHPYLVSFRCCHCQKFDKCSDNDVWDIVDELSRIAATGTAEELKLAQQSFGLNYDAEGLLFDRSLRETLKPITHWLRDWMHVMCVAGCANVEVEQIVNVLRSSGVDLQHVTNYFDQFVLPKSHGKVNKDWFTNKRVGKTVEERDGWKGFSAELLTLVPILADFLVVVVQPMDIIDGRYITCFLLVDRLLKLFSLGTNAAALHLDLIVSTIDRHAALFGDLYPTVVKPKYHHLFHIPDHIRSIGKLTNCFVTERRHRNVKAPASYVFNHFESAITKTQLCHMVSKVSTGTFSENFLLEPQELAGELAVAVRAVDPRLSGSLCSSRSAQFRCGIVTRCDLVMTSDHSVCQVERFWASTVDGCTEVLVFLKRLRQARDRHYYTASCDVIIVQAQDVVAVLIWAKDNELIKILQPAMFAVER